MEKCYPNLEDEIENLNPSIIFLLGKQVANFVLKKHSIRSFAFEEDFTYNSYDIDGIEFVPVHHPSYVLVYRRRNIESYVKSISSFLIDILATIS